MAPIQGVPGLYEVFAMNREDLAWCAGFLDGECCIRSHHVDSRFYPDLSVNQVHREVLDKLESILGVGKVTGPRERPGNSKPLYYYNVRGFEGVQYVVAAVWPWLGVVKRAQAMSVLIPARFGLVYEHSKYSNRGRGRAVVRQRSL